MLRNQPPPPPTSEPDDPPDGIHIIDIKFFPSFNI